jgi:phosphoribosylformimino-5-aminoimidazole carboxamide ribotide isomerase
MEIIPAIDIMEGRCVRLTQGVFSTRKTYSDDPLSLARSFEDAGIRRLHLVDLDGARCGRVVNLDVLEKIHASTRLVIDFGGGVKTNQDIQQVFDAGASMVTGGSIAVKDPDIFTSWIHQYGHEKIILGADVKGKSIMVSGWTKASEFELYDFLQHYVDKSIKYVICTDVDHDGMLNGPSLDLYKNILIHFPGINLVASGGVSSLHDLEQLEQSDVWGVIIGKALYEGRIKLEDFKRFL